MLTQIIAHILSYDVWFYVSHRLLHTKYLWRFHKTHHEKQRPTFLDTYHGHRFESAFQSLGYFLPFLLLKAPSNVAALTALVLVNARGMMRHDERTAWIVDGGHHLQHHLDAGKNYGERWIDALFSTHSSAQSAKLIA